VPESGVDATMTSANPMMSRMQCLTPTFTTIGSYVIDISLNGIDFITSPNTVYLNVYSDPKILSVEPLGGPSSGNTSVVVEVSPDTKMLNKNARIWCLFGDLESWQFKQQGKAGYMGDIGVELFEGKIMDETYVLCPVPFEANNTNRDVKATTPVRLTMNLVDFSVDSLLYAFYVAPEISSIVPSNVGFSTGEEVTIYGKNFRGNVQGRPPRCRFGSPFEPFNEESPITAVVTGTQQMYVTCKAPTVDTLGSLSVSLTLNPTTEIVTKTDKYKSFGLSLPNYFSDSSVTLSFWCPLGFVRSSNFSVQNAPTLCAKCQPGLFTQEVLPYQACHPCKPGTRSQLEGSTTESNCERCDMDRYSPVSGLKACTQCPRPDKMNPSSSREKCECKPGHVGVGYDFVEIARIAKDQQWPPATVPSTAEAAPFVLKECLNCPAGAICQNSGLVLSELQLQPGQWRAFSNSTSVYSCPNGADACLGGRRVCNSSSSVLQCGASCARGYKGPMCDSCQSEPVRFGKGSKSCVDCLSQRGLHQFIVAMLPILIVSIVALLTRMQDADNPLEQGPSVLLKIILNYFQLISLLRELKGVPWPDQFVHLLAVEDQAASSGNGKLDTAAISCELSNDVFFIPTFLMLSPLLAFAIPAVIFGTIFVFKSWRYTRRTQLPLPDAQKDDLRFLSFTTMLVALFLVYPQMLKGLFAFFVSVQVELWPFSTDAFDVNTTLHTGSILWVASIDLGQASSGGKRVGSGEVGREGE
jgi:hypothetical protein